MSPGDEVRSRRGPETPPPLPVAVPRTPFVLLVLLAVVGGVVGILLLNTKINENSFVLYELRQEQAALDQRQEQLEQEIAQARSPAQLEFAAHRLGLVSLRDDVVHLRLPDTPAGSPAIEEPTDDAPAAEEPADGAPGGEEPAGTAAAEEVDQP